MAKVNDRSDVASRRKRLRSLDIALCDELEDAGALTFEALREHVASRDLLNAQVSDETLWEGWHYAQRRRIIKPHAEGNEMVLSDRGRAVLSEAQHAAASASAPRARAVMRYLIPPGITGLVAAAVGVVSESTAVAIGAATVMVVALLYWLIAELTDYLFAKQVDPRFQRAELKRSVAWLDGDEVRWLGRTEYYEVVDKTTIKRLDMPNLPGALPQLTRATPPTP